MVAAIVIANYGHSDDDVIEKFGKDAPEKLKNL